MTTTAIQIGQLNETIEDAKKSMQLMIDSIRYDNHIAYAFPITTPFPGSELYDIAFQRGLLKSHQDFFDLFDPKVAMLSVTINMSAMSDTELMGMRQEMMQAYWKEKHLTMSHGACFVINTRRLLNSIDGKIDSMLWSRYRKHASVVYARKLYKILYDFVQNVMDIIWRRLWKVK